MNNDKHISYAIENLELGLIRWWVIEQESPKDLAFL